MVEINDRLTEAAVVALLLLVGSLILAFALALIGTLLANAFIGSVWLTQKLRKSWRVWRDSERNHGTD